MSKGGLAASPLPDYFCARKQEAEMASDTPIHDFVNPRLVGLLKDAIALGFERDAVVAVMIDIVTRPPFDTAEPDASTDEAPHPDFERSDDVVLVNNQSVAAPHQPGVRDEADFIKPVDWFSSNP
jgi:hypothetical protein